MNKSQKQLLIIGDSGVYGWGDNDYGGWCERLRQDWIKKVDYPIIYNLGIRGDGLEKVARRWKGEWVVRGETRRNFPDAIILSIGINDTARVGGPEGRPQLSTEAFRYGFQQLVKEIKSQCCLMITGITPVNEKAMPFANCLWYSNKSISIYESQIEETCLDSGIPFLPIHQTMVSEKKWKKYLIDDGIHLNAEGHLWFYNRVEQWSALINWANLN